MLRWLLNWWLVFQPNFLLTVFPKLRSCCRWLRKFGCWISFAAYATKSHFWSWTLHSSPLFIVTKSHPKFSEDYKGMFLWDLPFVLKPMFPIRFPYFTISFLYVSHFFLYYVYISFPYLSHILPICSHIFPTFFQHFRGENWPPPIPFNGRRGNTRRSSCPSSRMRCRWSWRPCRGWRRCWSMRRRILRGGCDHAAKALVIHGGYWWIVANRDYI